jgi:hypothetical protein
MGESVYWVAINNDELLGLFHVLGSFGWGPFAVKNAGEKLPSSCPNFSGAGWVVWCSSSVYAVGIASKVLQGCPCFDWLAVAGEGAGGACVVGAGYHGLGSLVEQFEQACGYVLLLVGVVAHDDCGVPDFGQDSGGVVKIALLVLAGEAAHCIECGLGCVFGVYDVLRKHGLGSGWFLKSGSRVNVANCGANDADMVACHFWVAYLSEKPNQALRRSGHISGGVVAFAAVCHGVGSSYSQRIQHRAAAACSHSVSVWQSYGIALLAAAAAITSRAAAVMVFSAVMLWAPVG